MADVVAQDTGGPGEADAFGPPGAAWTPVSPRLADIRRTVLLVLLVPLILAVVIGVGLLLSWLWALAPAVAGAALVSWVWWLVGRNAGSWGYAERAEDLLVRRGVFFRQLVIVPYGRMQQVDVTAGPLDRRFGVARVQLHTAAATTDAVIPGLVPAEAARLRERLSALGEARSAGL
jgi:membrane protein YdbS with pleckstrin-like domain